MKIVQETQLTLNKHRLGATVLEPVVTAFNPAVITVGSEVENISVDGDFDSFDDSFGDDEF